MKRILLSLGFLITLYLLILFAVHNSEPVHLKFGLWTTPMIQVGPIYQWALIFGMFIVGFTCSFVMDIGAWAARWKEVRGLRKELKSCKEALAASQEQEAAWEQRYLEEGEEEEEEESEEDESSDEEEETSPSHVLPH